jgi:hypothetical protein
MSETASLVGNLETADRSGNCDQTLSGSAVTVRTSWWRGMSPDAGGEVDPWERFDHALELARNRLDAARNRYEPLTEMGAAPPDGYASALREIEDDIGSVDDVLDVTDEEAARAETVASRAELLAEVLDASWTFQTELLDVELDVYRTWHASLEAIDEVDCSDATTQLSSLTELANDENYTQLRSGEQFTLESLRAHLTTAEERAMDVLAPEAYVQHRVEAVGEYEDQFTDDLRQLVQADASPQLKDDRAAVSELKDRLEEQLDGDEVDGDAVMDARNALEGATMLKYHTGYAIRAHEYCQRLADVLDRIEGATTASTDQFDARAVGEMTAHVEDAIVGATTKTDPERVVDLLREHDGSVRRGLAASDMDAEAFFDAVQTAFEDGDITDMEVTFE